jgi:hypothetical protein
MAEDDCEHSNPTPGAPRMEVANAADWSHVSSRFDLNSSAGMALSVIARVGSGCWIVGVITGAVGII